MTFGNMGLDGSVVCDFMFPGDSDPWLWGTDGINPGYSMISIIFSCESSIRLIGTGAVQFAIVIKKYGITGCIIFYSLNAVYIITGSDNLYRLPDCTVFILGSRYTSAILDSPLYNITVFVIFERNLCTRIEVSIFNTQYTTCLIELEIVGVRNIIVIVKSDGYKSLICIKFTPLRIFGFVITNVKNLDLAAFSDAVNTVLYIDLGYGFVFSNYQITVTGT